MNILISTPNSNFKIEDMRQAFNNNPLFKQEHLYYTNDNLSEKDLEKIEILIGADQQLANQIVSTDNSHLKWIQALSAGIDYLPLQQLRNQNVILTTLKGLHAEPIAETIIGMILGHYRSLIYAARQNNWQRPTQISQMIKNKRVIIFGTGHIGSRTAQLLQAFDAQVIGINHNGHPATNFSITQNNDQMTSTIKTADIIINTMPLTPNTKNFFNKQFFQQLEHQPLFISIGRGPSTNTTDLIQALKTNLLGAAALDVTDPEPLPADNPLWKMNNVLITPHDSGLYSEYLNEIMDIVNQNWQQFQKDGTVVINQADLTKGY